MIRGAGAAARRGPRRAGYSGRERRVQVVAGMRLAILGPVRARQGRAELTAAVAAEPFRERMRELLMLALYRSGRQADALASYRELQAILHREAGLDPAPALQQLHHQILQADPELLTPPDVAGLPRSVQAAAGRLGRVR
jgi:hypothetical protein